jgi:LPXTG-motif cell wall-anchored protein
MYNELPHTGFGAIVLTGAALLITGLGALARWLTRP